jgi:hypothetical protein
MSGRSVSRQLAISFLAIFFAMFVATFVSRCYVAPQGSIEANGPWDQGPGPTSDGTLPDLQDRNPKPIGSNFASTFVPLDSWISGFGSSRGLGIRGQGVRGYASLDPNGMRTNDRECRAGSGWYFIL